MFQSGVTFKMDKRYEQTYLPAGLQGVADPDLI